MKSNASGTEKRIGAATAREVRAITAEMDISRGSDPLRGTFVVAADGDENTVDLRANTCDCVDSRLSLPSDGSEVCAHRHRVRYALRPEDIPHALREHMDRRLVRSTARYASLSVEERAPITVEERAAAVVRDSASAVDEPEPDHADDERPVVIADGGVDVPARTRRACVESMVVHPHGSGSGMFDVYNAEGRRYVVDLRDGVCECPDFEHREANCKHQRRVRLEFGLAPFEDVPAAIRDEHAALTDVELARKRRGIDVDPEPITVGADASKPGRKVATDGGRVIAPSPQNGSEETTHAPGCDNPECEGLDGDAERPLLSWECWEVWS